MSGLLLWWSGITWDTDMRDIGWTYVFLVPVFVAAAWIVLVAREMQVRAGAREVQRLALAVAKAEGRAEGRAEGIREVTAAVEAVLPTEVGALTLTTDVFAALADPAAAVAQIKARHNVEVDPTHCATCSAEHYRADALTPKDPT